MTTNIFHFQEYVVKNLYGDMFSPYIEDGKWHIVGDVITLEVMGKLCNLDEEELTMLRLRYGA